MYGDWQTRLHGDAVSGNPYRTVKWPCSPAADWTVGMVQCPQIAVFSADCCNETFGYSHNVTSVVCLFCRNDMKCMVSPCLLGPQAGKSQVYFWSYASPSGQHSLQHLPGRYVKWLCANLINHCFYSPTCFRLLSAEPADEALCFYLTFYLHLMKCFDSRCCVLLHILHARWSICIIIIKFL